MPLTLASAGARSRGRLSGRGAKLLAGWCRAFSAVRWRGSRARTVLAAWFPALRLTRLETRTKELSSQASQADLRIRTAYAKANRCDPASPGVGATPARGALDASCRGARACGVRPERW